jgi:hypothetical protein
MPLTAIYNTNSWQKTPLKINSKPF